MGRSKIKEILMELVLCYLDAEPVDFNESSHDLHKS